jgi:polysaccharide export outer membrane protein
MPGSLRTGLLFALLLPVSGLAGQAPPGEAPPVVVNDATYPVRPGDLIRLRIWREEDLSGEFQVNAAGTAVIPRLGEYVVVGETSQSLASRLIEDYRRYLRNPSIEITVLRRINVLGAVAKPGVYNVDPTVTIADALALAGGVTPIGNQDNIRIIRDGQELTASISDRTQIGDTPIQSGDQIFVAERSIFRRNTALYTTLISAAVTLSIALFLR